MITTVMMCMAMCMVIEYGHANDDHGDHNGDHYEHDDDDADSADAQGDSLYWIPCIGFLVLH